MALALGTPSSPLKGPAILLLVGLLIGLHPVFRFGLPRSSEAFSHLENLRRIPSAWDALDFTRMVDLFQNREHYAKYPLFYVLAKAVSVDAPWRAALFSGVVFALLPVLAYLLARSLLGSASAFLAGLVVATTSAFVYTMNFFSGGEPLAFAVLFAGLLVHSRHRFAAGLPLYILVIFLHPFTALFLWVVLLALTFLSSPDCSRQVAEWGLCLLAYSASFLAWILVQIHLKLPLGHFITDNVDATWFSAAIMATALGTLGTIFLRQRFKSIEGVMDPIIGLYRRRLTVLLVVLEIVLLVWFGMFGVPGTEQSIPLRTALYYAPLLAAVGLIGLRKDEIDPFTSALTTSVLTMIAAGMILFPRGIPVYRLAPYGAVALGLLLGPCVKNQRCRLVLPFILAGLAATVYPGPSVYFGFDEQYYPCELAAVERVSDLTVSGAVFTDVRMEDLVRFVTGKDVEAPTGDPVRVSGSDAALLNLRMRRTGFYPAGAEWFRQPLRIDLSLLDRVSTRSYDNGQCEILLLSGTDVEVEMRVD